MSELAKKLRDLAERLESQASGHTSGPISHAKATVYLSIKMDLAPLLAAANRLESQNRRLRELVREAWDEGFEVGDVGNPRRSGWAMSKVKAALDALDKEGSDA